MKKNSKLMIIIAILLAFCVGMQCGRAEEQYLIEKTAVNETGSEAGNDVAVDDDKEGHFSIFTIIFLIIVVIIIAISIFTTDKPAQE